MPTKVHFVPVSRRGGLPRGAIPKLFRAAGLDESFGPEDLVALKLHFGNPGNENVWRPKQCREVAAEVRDAGGKPFLTDANVLYHLYHSASRHNAVDHLAVAHSNGFTYAAVGCPVIIADGLRGDNSVAMRIPGGRHYKNARIDGGIARSDAVIALTHVTGHILFGYAGAIKNLGMGSGSPAGKQMMHEDFVPEIDPDDCTGCGTCVEHCPAGAIAVSKRGKARLTRSKCIGCAECAAHCPTGAIPVQWGDSEGVQERTVEFCAAIMAGRSERFGFINLLTNVTGSCDCMHDTGRAVVPDIGAVAGRDVVAVDQASLDLMAASKRGLKRLRAAQPHAEIGLAHELAEGMKLGSREYELVEV